jgi:hypothetical protein
VVQLVERPRRQHHRARRERVDLLRADDFARALFVAPDARQHRRQPLVRQAVIRVQLQRLSEQALGPLPVPLGEGGDEAEHGVGVAQRVVEFERAARGGLRLLVALVRGDEAEDARPVVVGGDACVSERIVRVERERVLEGFEHAGEGFGRELVPEVAPAQVGVVRLRVVGAALFEAAPLVAGQLRDE